MEVYDDNKDAKISPAELQASPALGQSQSRIDMNRDGTLTLDEIQSRFEALDRQSDLVPIELRVLAKGRPLVGATVTLIPEPFMGEGLQSYSGTTNEGGICDLAGSEMQLPGLPNGFYQVKVLHSVQGIDAKRGCEISDDIGNRVEIAL